MKSMWRYLTTDTLWSNISCDKYLKNMDKAIRFMRGHRSWGDASPVWNGLMETRQWILPGLTWVIGSGTKIILNEIVFDTSLSNILSPQLIEFFRLKGYRDLSHFCSSSRFLFGFWRDSNYFRLNCGWKRQWDLFTASLYRLGVTLSRKEDRLHWIHNQSGSVTARTAYL